MPTTIAVRFRYNPKIYWFSADGKDVKQGDYVLIDRESAQELGLVTEDPFEVDAEQEATLNAPLKPISRVITEADYDMLDELEAKARDAYHLFRELAKKHNLDMKPIDVDYLVGGNKAVFYFSSEDRVDFRDLVRDLASQLHIHVDMHQIGVRDEARAIGGLGHCGEELCCARLGGEFFPVSIRMAKEQDLPLNPAKVSGTCGRLMCCLRYEFEAYKDFKNRAPKIGAIVDTPVGQAKVISFDTPREVVTLKLCNPEDPKIFTVPFSEFAIDPEKDKNDKTGKCPGCSVSLDTLHACCARSLLQELAALEKPQGGFTDGMERGEGDNRRPRRRSSGQGGTKASGERAQKGESRSGAQENSNGGRNRRRRSSGGGAQGASDGQQRRPAAKGAGGNSEKNSRQGSGSASGQKQGSANRRRTKDGGAQKSGTRQGQGAATGAKTSKPRPGQKSSGLHTNPSAGASAHENSSSSSSGYGNRKRRRSTDIGSTGGTHGQDGKE